VPGLLRVISLQDLTARAARLSWDLSDNVPVAFKYARDFVRLLELVKTDEVESAWQEHRKAHSPESFSDAAKEIHRQIAARPDLLISTIYSIDVNATCERCRDTQALPLANPSRILALLGYC
jgi:hypothetical protein